MSLLNLALGMKPQMVNKGGLFFQSADRHEGKPDPLLWCGGGRIAAQYINFENKNFPNGSS